MSIHVSRRALGNDYVGYFEHGNAAELVAMLERCRADQQEGAASSPDPLLGRLRASAVVHARG